MYTFPELIKKIRDEAGLTQAEFAKAVDVSPVLITMVETGQKEVSKKLLLKIAERLEVHPSSITPFLYSAGQTEKGLSLVERQFLTLGTRLQEYLIKHKSKTLRKYVRQPLS